MTHEGSPGDPRGVRARGSGGAPPGEPRGSGGAPPGERSVPPGERSVPPGERSVPPAGSVYACYIRHGENQANLTGELSCKAVDYPLTERGDAQARELAARLAREQRPAAIYSSPLRRATETAERIAESVRGEVVVAQELRELNVGDLDGRSDEQAWSVYLDVAYAWQAGDHDRAFPGGEDYHEMTGRLAQALRRALDHPPGSRVLIVGHGGLIRAGIPAICPGVPMPGTNIPNCGVAELALRAGGPAGVTGTLLHWPGARARRPAGYSEPAGVNGSSSGRLG